MSLLGTLNDWWTQQPVGTTDQVAATDASVNAQEAAITQNQLNQGLITQAEYDQTQADYAAQPDSSAAGQLGETGLAGLSTVPDSLAHPVDTLTTGLEFEGRTAGNVAGAVGGAAVKAASSAIKGAAGGILGNTPWWLYLAIAAGVFIYLGGGGFLERRGRGYLSK